MQTQEITLKIIADLEALSCLWDVSCPNYRNRYERRAAMESLANKYGMSHHDMEKKTHNLKTQFRREHRKLVLAKRSGSLSKLPWFGYQPLTFLLKNKGYEEDDEGISEISVKHEYLTSEQSESDNEIQAADESSSNSWLPVQGIPLVTTQLEPVVEDTHSDDWVPVAPTVNTQPTPRRRKEPPEVREAEHQMDKSFTKNAVSTRKEEKEDEFDLFGRILAKKLRKLPELEGEIVMHDIDGMVLEVRRRCAAKSSPSTDPAASVSSSANQNYSYTITGPIKIDKNH